MSNRTVPFCPCGSVVPFSPCGSFVWFSPVIYIIFVQRVGQVIPSVLSIFLQFFPLWQRIALVIFPLY